MNDSVKTYVWFSLLAFLLVVLFVTDILVGTVRIPFHDALSILSGKDHDHIAWSHILFQIRVPKAFTAVFAGSALSVCGLQMQTLFRNPLASPSELGISAGAALGTGLFIFFLDQGVGIQLHRLGIGASWMIALAAATGAGAVFSLLLIISRFVKDNVVLLIVGLMLGTLTLAITGLWQYFSRPEQLQAFVSWTFGSLGVSGGPRLTVLASVTIAGLLFSFFLSKTLNALLLGENYASNLGISPRRARTLILLNTCLLTGVVTAFCGPIGFVGIAVPHVMRSLFVTSNHMILMPACCLGGALALLCCDLIAQLPGNGIVLPINIATSLAGAPTVIWIILKMNNLRNSF